MICWTPTIFDCDGNLESPLTWRHEFAYVRVVGTQICGLDEEGNPIGGCPIYIRENFIPSVEDADPCLPFEPVLPGLGEVLLMKVTTFDEARNPDCGY